MADYWELLKPYFEPDDGACPEICLLQLKATEVIAIFDDLTARNPRLVGSPVYLDLTDGTEKPLLGSENPATRVTQRAAEPFHALLQHVKTPIGEVPEIGVFVLPEIIALDYAKGPDWTKETVAAFLCLFLQLLELVETPNISVDSQEGPDFPRDFGEALRLFQEEYSA